MPSRRPTQKAPQKAPAENKTTRRRIRKARKAGRKLGAPSRLVVLEAEDPWSKERALRGPAMLRDDVKRLTGELAEVEEDLAGMIENSGEGAGNDQADVGSASFERDQEMVIVNNARDMLEQSPARPRAHLRPHLRPVRELREPHRQGAPDGLPAGDLVPELQAARGASLITSETPGHPTTRRAPPAPVSTLLAFASRPAARWSTWSPSTSPSASSPDTRRSRSSGTCWSCGSCATPGCLQRGRLLTPVITVSRSSRPSWSPATHSGCAVVVGDRPGSAARRCVGNLLDRLFRAPAPSAATSSTSSPCRTGRCSRRRHLHRLRGGLFVVLLLAVSAWTAPGTHDRSRDES